MPTRREVLRIAAAVAAAPAGAALASTFPQPPHQKLLPYTQDDVTMREIGIFAEEPPTALDRINVRRTVLWHQRLLQQYVNGVLDIDADDPQPVDVVATPELVSSFRAGLVKLMEFSKQRGACRDYQVGVAGFETNWVFSIAFRHQYPEHSMITFSSTTKWTGADVAHIAALARAGVPLPPSYTA